MRSAAERAVLDGSEGPMPIGAYLSRQRRLRDISLEELAAITRLPLRSLQRLEEGVFDRDPDGFTRGFVRTVGLALGLDPDETVAMMLPEVTPGTSAAAPWLRFGIWAIAGTLVLAIILGGISLLVGLSAETGQTEAARDRVLVIRKDAVRSLAEQVGVLPAGSANPPESPAQRP